MSSKRAYAGNARFIEMGSTGIPFRLLINIDHIESFRFEEQFDERKVVVPGTEVPPQRDDAGNVIAPGKPPETRLERVSIGWQVVLVIGGLSNGIGFPTMESAMACYNDLVRMISANGVPVIARKPLAPPKMPSAIVDVDGDAIAAAVDAADLHPELAGDDGEEFEIAENDDDAAEDFTVTDEDLELLENPDIDEDAIEDHFLPAATEDPPKTS